MQQHIDPLLQRSASVFRPPPSENPGSAHVKNENPMSEPMKVTLGVFHGWSVAMKYPWNAFIGHE